METRTIGTKRKVEHRTVYYFQTLGIRIDQRASAKCEGLWSMLFCKKCLISISGCISFKCICEGIDESVFAV